MKRWREAGARSAVHLAAFRIADKDLSPDGTAMDFLFMYGDAIGIKFTHHLYTSYATLSWQPSLGLSNPL